YVNDFVFPSDDDENQNQKLPLWDAITYTEKSETESNIYNKQNGQWVESDVKNLDKCRNFNIVTSAGHVRLIYISYKNVANPLESLNEVLVHDLEIPEVRNTLKIIKRGKQRLVFEVPNAIYALLALQKYCQLYNASGHLNYEILATEE
ncbi:hypothetical protein KR032_003937, partial [Drosophila birchii]